MYIHGNKSLHFSNVDLTNKTDVFTELAYSEVMEISNVSLRNILFYPSIIHCSMLTTVWLTHLFIEITMFSISVTDPPEWTPTGGTMPSVIGANRSRLSLFQTQRNIILKTEWRGESMHSPTGCGLGCYVGIKAASVGGRAWSSQRLGWLQLRLYVTESAWDPAS